jgi:hypothetical protein
LTSAQIKRIKTFAYVFIAIGVVLTLYGSISLLIGLISSKNSDAKSIEETIFLGTVHSFLKI